MKITIQNVCDNSKLKEHQIENIYMVGSRVYDTFDSTSDYNIVVITNSSVNNLELKRGNLNITIYNINHFKEKLKEQEMIFIETALSPIVLKENIKLKFLLNKELFIKELIQNSDETFAKFDKLANEDAYKAVKKMFHSIRILNFAKELIENNNIDFSSQSNLWKNLQSQYFNGEDILETYPKLRLKLIDELKQI